LLPNTECPSNRLGGIDVPTSLVKSSSKPLGQKDTFQLPGDCGKRFSYT
jgi:hypothetical protein